MARRWHSCDAISAARSGDSALVRVSVRVRVRVRVRLGLGLG